MIQILGDNNAVIGGLHMVHEREDQKVCGPVMPQGKNKSITGLVLPTTISAQTYLQPHYSQVPNKQVYSFIQNS